MRRIAIPLKFGIGTKLGLSIGVGVVLLGGMIASEHFSSRFVGRLVAAANQQQAIVHESIMTEVMLQTARVAGRDIRKAQTTDQVEAKIADLQKVADQARAKISTLEALAVDADTRKNFNNVSELTLAYIDALRQIGAKQNEILSFFKKLDEAELSWTRGFNQLVNSDEFTLMPNLQLIEALTTEASSAFKDARTATWRYFVLSEPTQVARITGAADQAFEKLGYARRDVKDDKVAEGLAKLQAQVPEYIAVLKGIIQSIDNQNRIQSNQANSAESAVRLLLDDIVSKASTLSDKATRDAMSGTEQAERQRIGGIHSIDYPDKSRFVRVTGTNLDKINRISIDLKTGDVKQMTPQMAS